MPSNIEGKLIETRAPVAVYIETLEAAFAVSVRECESALWPAGGCPDQATASTDSATSSGSSIARYGHGSPVPRTRTFPAASPESPGDILAAVPSSLTVRRATETSPTVKLCSGESPYLFDCRRIGAVFRRKLLPGHNRPTRKGVSPRAISVSRMTETSIISLVVR